MSRTPTPYRYKAYEKHGLKRAYLIEEETGHVFAEGIRVDDAAFIVEACNAYERPKKELEADDADSREHLIKELKLKT